MVSRKDTSKNLAKDLELSNLEYYSKPAIVKTKTYKYGESNKIFLKNDSDYDLIFPEEITCDKDLKEINRCLKTIVNEELKEAEFVKGGVIPYNTLTLGCKNPGYGNRLFHSIKYLDSKYSFL